jgi:hypothetical protein
VFIYDHKHEIGGLTFFECLINRRPRRGVSVKWRPTTKTDNQIVKDSALFEGFWLRFGQMVFPSMRV